MTFLDRQIDKGIKEGFDKVMSDAEPKGSCCINFPTFKANNFQEANTTMYASFGI